MREGRLPSAFPHRSLTPVWSKRMSKLLTTVAALSVLAACSAAARPGAMDHPDTSAAAVAAPAELAGGLVLEQTAPPAAEPARRTAPAPQLAERVASTSAHERVAASCDVRARRSANGMLVEARVVAHRNISGEYELVITKSGGGNSADITQGGPFTVSAGSSATLGQNELSVERDARLRAVLIIRDRDGEVCRDVFRF